MKDAPSKSLIQKPGQVAGTCPCGATFYRWPRNMTNGQGLYCSRSCFYKYRRPSSTQIQPGQIGPASPSWKGDDAGYHAIHRWINAHYGKAGRCEHCGRACRTDWANVSQEYRREPDDWLELCRPCHSRFDRDHRGAIARRFGS